VTTVQTTSIASEVVTIVGAATLPANSTWSATDWRVAAIAVIATSTENAAAAEERNSESE